MAFINMQPVSKYFGKYECSDGESDIKCPVCGNGFFVAADDDDPKATLCLIHTPETVDKEYIERSEFTCPFLLKPLALTGPVEYNLHRIAEKESWEERLKKINADKVLSDTPITISLIKFLQESIKQYACMLKLNNTICRYCKSTYKLTYAAEKETCEFSCSFGCDCTFTRNVEDLSRLSLRFMDNWEDSMALKDKRLNFLDAIISRMPEGSSAKSDI